MRNGATVKFNMITSDENGIWVCISDLADENLLTELNKEDFELRNESGDIVDFKFNDPLDRDPNIPGHEHFLSPVSGTFAGTYTLIFSKDGYGTISTQHEIGNNGENQKVAVALATNIRYEVVNGDVQLKFDQPLDTTGITEYSVEFSKDGGSTWEGTHSFDIEGSNIVPMSDLAHELNSTTTYNKVRVKSCVADESDYAETIAEADINFGITVSGTAIDFTVSKNADNDYNINLTNAEDALYSIGVTKADTVPDYYPLGFGISESTQTINLVGQENHKIVDGSGFIVRKITNIETTGFTITEKQANPVLVGVME